MKEERKLKTNEVGQEAEETRNSEKTAPGFQHAEEVLRFDAANTLPPPEIERRLQESMKKELSTETSWWKRLFSKGG